MATVGAHARFNEFLFTTGGAVVRNQLFVRFSGEGTIAGIRGASLLKGRQHADTTLIADHAVADCTSREVFKSVLDDEGRSVFQGKIIVRRHAQKTDAKMATHALLLSDTAEADNKPELEIFADDVKCAHGAAVGDLDADSMFYLRARGIPEAEARNLLIRAFLEEAVSIIESEDIRATVWQAVEDALSRAMEGHP
jgi:Fe-S cluster assembly protein SufD